MIDLPCGGTACFDDGAGYGYRCNMCDSVVGSIGQPTSCKDAAKQWEANKILGGKSWDEHLITIGGNRTLTNKHPIW